MRYTQQQRKGRRRRLGDRIDVARWSSLVVPALVLLSGGEHISALLSRNLVALALETNQTESFFNETTGNTGSDEGGSNDDDGSLIAVLPSKGSVDDTNATTSTASVETAEETLNIVPLCLSALHEYDTNGVFGLGPAEYQAAIAGLVSSLQGRNDESAIQNSTNNLYCFDEELPSELDLKPRSTKAWRTSFDAATCLCPSNAIADPTSNNGDTTSDADSSADAVADDASSSATEDVDENRHLTLRRLDDCCQQDTIPIDTWDTVLSVCQIMQGAIQQECTSRNSTVSSSDLALDDPNSGTVITNHTVSLGLNETETVTSPPSSLVVALPTTPTLPPKRMQSPTRLPLAIATPTSSPIAIPPNDLTVSPTMNVGATEWERTTSPPTTSPAIPMVSSAQVKNRDAEGEDRSRNLFVYVGIPLLLVALASVVAIIVWYDRREQRQKQQRRRLKKHCTHPTPHSRCHRHRGGGVFVDATIQQQEKQQQPPPAWHRSPSETLEIIGVVAGDATISTTTPKNATTDDDDSDVASTGAVYTTSQPDDGILRLEEGGNDSHNNHVSPTSSWTHSPLRSDLTSSSHSRASTYGRNSSQHSRSGSSHSTVKEHSLNDLIRTLHLDDAADEVAASRVERLSPKHIPATSGSPQFEARPQQRPPRPPPSRGDDSSLKSMSSWSENTDLVFQDEEGSIQSDTIPVIRNLRSSKASSSTSKLLLQTWNLPTRPMLQRETASKSAANALHEAQALSQHESTTSTTDRPSDDKLNTSMDSGTSAPTHATDTISTSSSSSDSGSDGCDRKGTDGKRSNSPIDTASNDDEHRTLLDLDDEMFLNEQLSL